MIKSKKNQPVKPLTKQQLDISTNRLIEYVQGQNLGSIEEMNAFIEKNVLGKRIDKIVPPDSQEKTNKQKSEDLIYEAYECEPAKGIRLAKKALKLDPENIRAMTYIGHLEEDDDKAIGWLKKSVDVGYKQLGEQFFKKNIGYFWLMHETRPYMEARFEYAQILAHTGQNTEALSHLNDLIKLNPNDNQGVRYQLSSLLLIEKKWTEYEKLFKKYKDEESAFWLFNYAFYIFLTKGKCIESENALKKAHFTNRHVNTFISSRKLPEFELDGAYSPGDEKEAFYFMNDNMYLFLTYPELIEWIMIESKKLPFLTIKRSKK